MIYFKLIKNNKIIVNNFLDSPNVADSPLSKMISECMGDNCVELYATDYDYKVLKNKHIATRTFGAYFNLFDIIDQVKDEYNREYTILSHNLITSHSLLQDALEQIVPENDLSRAETHKDQIDIVQIILNNDSQAAAEQILSIKKRVADLQAQIEGLRMLKGNNKLNNGNHNIYKVLQNILFPFYDDFNRNNLTIKWHIDYETANNSLVRTDYKILNVALHHFFNNVIKYARQYSYIDINFYPEEKVLSFGMISLRIEKKEITKIFDLNYRGKNVKGIDSGEGVGMYMTKKALDLLGATIEIEMDYNKQGDAPIDPKYNFNNFKIQFPK